jgi:AcrR family transcriptional regulator
VSREHVADDPAGRPRPGPTRRRGAELEQAILRAALDELAETGYSGLAMDRVARRAGTNKNAIYRRWPSRAVAHGEAAPEALHPRVATVAMIGLSRRQPLGTRTAAV